MKNFKDNKLESIFVALITEQCWNSTSALLSNQNHKNKFKTILFWKDTTLNCREPI